MKFNQPKRFKIFDNPPVNEEIIPSADTDPGAGTCWGRYWEGDPMIGLDIGRSPG